MDRKAFDIICLHHLLICLASHCPCVFLRGVQPPGLEDIDPSAIEELMISGPGGMPDSMRLRKLLKSNPALQKMMEAYALAMGMGGMEGMGCSGSGMMGGIGGARNDAQRARLEERLRAKQNAGDMSIPEVKATKPAARRRRRRRRRR